MKDKWQPIETAPKTELGEGVPDVLLYGAQLGVRTGRAGVYADDFVFAAVANVSGNIAGTLATHWMPLPEPPTP